MLQEFEPPIECVRWSEKKVSTRKIKIEYGEIRIIILFIHEQCNLCRTRSYLNRVVII